MTVQIDREQRIPRTEIALAWRRAELSGLAPSSSLEWLTQVEIDRQSRLLVAATPVLGELAEELLGTRFCVLLADSEARIVDRRFGESKLGALLDQINAVPGSTFDEATTGTNSIATPFELRQGFRVIGTEHYLDSLKGFSCYGHPIIHPVTRRLEGVIDITGYAEDSNSLLAPFLMRAAHQIEERLLQGSRAAQQHLLSTYQIAATRTTDPVVVVGEGVTLTNQPAMDQLAPTDFVVLRAIAADAPLLEVTSTSITLASGRRVKVHLEPIPRSAEGVLIKLSPADPTYLILSSESPMVLKPRTFGGPSRSVRRTDAEQWRDQLISVLIAGEAGTGRSTAAREHVGCDPVAQFDALDIGEVGQAHWIEDVTAALTVAGTVILENIQLLPESAAHRVRRLLLMKDRSSRLIVTTAQLSALEGEQAALASVFLAKVEIAPLRQRRAEIPGIAIAMLKAERPGAVLDLSSTLVDHLVNQPWPGNLQEMHAVVRHLSRARVSGTLTPNDLPPAYRKSAAHRARTPLEQSEYDTIVAALRTCEGNKVQAAKHLGIARATLYSRIRRFRIRE